MRLASPPLRNLLHDPRNARSTFRDLRGNRSGGTVLRRGRQSNAIAVTENTRLSRNGQRRSRLFHRAEDLQQQILLNPQKLVVIGGQHVSIRFDVQRIGPDTRKPHRHLPDFDLRIRAEYFRDRRQHLANLFRRRIPAQVERGMEKYFVSFGEILDRHRGKLAIRHGDQRPVRRPQSRGTQPDIFYRAGTIAEAAVISHEDRPVTDNRHSAKEILNRLLGRQRDRDTADAQPGEYRRRVVTPGAKNRGDGEKDHDHFDHPVSQRNYRRRNSALPCIHRRLQTVRDEVQNTRYQPRDRQKKNERETPVHINTQQRRCPDKHHPSAKEDHRNDPSDRASQQAEMAEARQSLRARRNQTQ